MSNRLAARITILGLTGMIGFQLAPVAQAQVINPDRLSFFNRPIAWQTERGTFFLNALLDLAARETNNGDARFEELSGVSRFEYAHQLHNDWDVGASYEIDYQSERAEQSEDTIKVFVEDQWGFASLGNVDRELFDRFGRQPAAGLLAFDEDDFALGLEENGGFYQWSSPDTRLALTLDTEGNAQTGIAFSKPVGAIDYLFALRGGIVEPASETAQGVERGTGVALVASARRGRLTIDGQLLQERLELVDGNTELDLTALSVGVHYRFNRAVLSMTARSRENALDNREQGIAIGLRYALSRGLSVNLGARSEDSEAFPEDIRAYAISLRYEL